MSGPIVIVGAGPAGSAAALTLRRYLPAVRVCLVERQPTSGSSGGAHASAANRDIVAPKSCSAIPGVGETLSPGVLPLLGYLGLRQSFQAQGHLPALGTASAWGSPELQERHYLFTGRGEGWHIDRAAFDAWLRNEALAAGAELIQGKLRRVSPGPAGFTLDVGHQVLAAGALVDATGRSARVARLLGARVTCVDSLVAQARWYDASPTASTSEGALIETVQDGWWYSATLPQGRAVQMLMADANTFQRTSPQLDPLWDQLLRSAPNTAARTHAWRARDERAVRPAHTQRTQPAWGKRWVAVGDAACAFDPLAALGIGFALRSGMEGARVVAAALEGDPEPGRAYAQGLREIGADYGARLHQLYGLERRWPQSPFWANRQHSTSRDDRSGPSDQLSSFSPLEKHAP